MSSTSIPLLNSEEGETPEVTKGNGGQTDLTLSKETCLPHHHLNSYTLDMSSSSNSRQAQVERQTSPSKKELLSPSEQTDSVTSNIQPKLALARSRSQHFIGKATQVKTEFVFADSVADFSVDLIGECVLPAIKSAHIFITEIPYTDWLAFLLFFTFNSWSDWEAIPMYRETDNIWSVEVSLNRGYHEFCFLVDGTTLVTSSRHKSNKSTRFPGLEELNWRNIYGRRPVAIHPVPSAPVAVLKEFLSGVGVISVHENSYGPSSLQGSLYFPSVPSITPSAELGNETLKAKDLVMHLRIPIFLLYLTLLYLSFIGLAIVSHLAAWK